MPCLFAIGAAFAPRLTFLFIWLFTPLVTRAFQTFVGPLFGVIFLPFTSLFYVLAWTPGMGIYSWGWFWVFCGFLLDLSSWASSIYYNRQQIPGAGYSA
jgi:hypothetical protein